ncbi:acyltransferase domain-containing protein [Modestobacter sp. NPDC049651]|uniref:ACP S-malonyltransferase n=1 Tax=unclassified Modestobacter TaxID=2643866 RepID=UPI0033C21AE5
MTGGPALVLQGEDGAVPGMLDGWLTDESARRVVAEAAEVVGRDVAEWWRERGNLVDPVAAALEIVVTGVAGAASLRARGLRPVAVAGHDVGEFAALVVAGALPLAQVVELVHCREELLSCSARPSDAGMAAVVGPGAAQVADAVVADLGGTLTVAAVDGPDQVLLSGHCAELSRAGAAAVGAGLTWRRMPGRAPCHGPLVQPVADHLAAELADLDWSAPSVPVVPNADAVPTRDPGRLARNLAAHLTSTVQWAATCRALLAAGATGVVEVGSVAVLGPLVRQAHHGVPVHLAAAPGPLPTPETSEPALAGSAPTRGET